MNINSERSAAAVADLQRRKESFRKYVRNLSPTEKILELEALQERYFELMRIREDNGGLPVPEMWQRWNKAQQTVKK